MDILRIAMPLFTCDYVNHCIYFLHSLIFYIDLVDSSKLDKRKKILMDRHFIKLVLLGDAEPVM